MAGIAAQLLALFPDCTNSQIRNVMLRTARHVGSAAGCNRGYGSGLVQGRAAYDMLKADGCGAGGEALDVPSSAAVGGCEQNPDYVASDNPNRDVCVDAANPRLAFAAATLWVPVSCGVLLLASSVW